MAPARDAASADAEGNCSSIRETTAWRSRGSSANRGVRSVRCAASAAPAHRRSLSRSAMAAAPSSPEVATAACERTGSCHDAPRAANRVRSASTWAFSVRRNRNSAGDVRASLVTVRLTIRAQPYKALRFCKHRTAATAFYTLPTPAHFHAGSSESEWM
jgi:hypothetical protein